MLPFPGNKHDVLKACAAGEILPSGRDSLVTHRALNLEHWLVADALYGIVYNQVTGLCSVPQPLIAVSRFLVVWS